MILERKRTIILWLFLSVMPIAGDKMTYIQRQKNTSFGKIIQDCLKKLKLDKVKLILMESGHDSKVHCRWQFYS